MTMTTAQLKELIKKTQTHSGVAPHLDRAEAVRELATAPKTKEANDALINAIMDEDVFVARAAIKVLSNRMSNARIYTAVENAAIGWSPVEWQAQYVAQNAVKSYWRSEMIAACE